MAHQLVQTRQLSKSHLIAKEVKILQLSKFVLSNFMVSIVLKLIISFS